MSLADNALHRARWLLSLAHIKAEIEDLRLEITAALQSTVSAPTMIQLVEADVHLTVAIAELGDASDRMRSIR